MLGLGGGQDSARVCHDRLTTCAHLSRHPIDSQIILSRNSQSGFHFSSTSIARADTHADACSVPHAACRWKPKSLILFAHCLEVQTSLQMNTLEISIRPSQGLRERLKSASQVHLTTRHAQVLSWKLQLSEPKLPILFWYLCWCGISVLAPKHIPTAKAWGGQLPVIPILDASEPVCCKYAAHAWVQVPQTERLYRTHGPPVDNLVVVKLDIHSTIPYGLRSLGQ